LRNLLINQPSFPPIFDRQAMQFAVNATHGDQIGLMLGAERISELMRTRQIGLPSFCDSAMISPLELPTTTRPWPADGPRTAAP
jgi:hypothetical protein